MKSSVLGSFLHIRVDVQIRFYTVRVDADFFKYDKKKSVFENIRIRVEGTFISLNKT